LDVGRLIALDQNNRQVIVMLAHAAEFGARVIVSATALAQVNLRLVAV
jgi:hypothetical protein